MWVFFDIFSYENKIIILGGHQYNRNKVSFFLNKFPKQLLLNSQKRPGSGSVIRKNTGSGSALIQCGSETLLARTVNRVALFDFKNTTQGGQFSAVYSTVHYCRILTNL
jgi:hypothetical protein